MLAVELRPRSHCVKDVTTRCYEFTAGVTSTIDIHRKVVKISSNLLLSFDHLYPRHCDLRLSFILELITWQYDFHLELVFPIFHFKIFLRCHNFTIQDFLGTIGKFATVHTQTDLSLVLYAVLSQWEP